MRSSAKQLPHRLRGRFVCASLQYVERRRAICPPPRVHISTERANGRRVGIGGGCVQRRPPIIGNGTHVGAEFDEQSAGRRAPPRRGRPL